MSANVAFYSTYKEIQQSWKAHISFDAAAVFIRNRRKIMIWWQHMIYSFMPWSGMKTLPTVTTASCSASFQLISTWW